MESPLGLLVGSWEFEAVQDRRSMGRERPTFEWIEDGAFVLERTDAEWMDPGWLANAPVWTRPVIGFDDTTGDQGFDIIHRKIITGRPMKTNDPISHKSDIDRTDLGERP